MRAKKLTIAAVCVILVSDDSGRRQKMAFRLPQAQRMRLAGELLESLPPHREPVTLKELEKRAEEIASGKVKPMSSPAFDRHLARLRKSIAG